MASISYIWEIFVYRTCFEHLDMESFKEFNHERVNFWWEITGPDFLYTI